MDTPNDTKAELERRMAAAVAAEDFETAARLRDAIALMDGDRPMPPSRLRRQQPGAMGLGTSEQVFVPPKGWVPPKPPDLMTTGKKRRR
jgi:hypothetical protein